MNKIGERIKNRRLELGLTQTELAKKAGYTSRSTISRIEDNERNIPADKIVAIASVLKVTPAFLMGWINDTDEAGNLITPATQFEDLQPTEQKVMERIQFLSTGNQVAVLNLINQLIDAQAEFEK